MTSYIGLESLWYFCFIVGSFAVTLLFDAAQAPKSSQAFFWQHWWHTPLLIYTSILLYWPISLILYHGGTIYYILIINGIAASITFSIICYIWIHCIRRQQVSPPKHQGNFRAANSLLLLGSFISLSSVLTYTFFLFEFNLPGYFPIPFPSIPILFLVLIVGLVVYLPGFFLRIYTQIATK